MGKHTFKDFLKKRRWSDDLDRQFVDAAELDPTLPDAASWEQLEHYLNEHEAVPTALAAARYVWEQYEKERTGCDVDQASAVHGILRSRVV